MHLPLIKSVVWPPVNITFMKHNLIQKPIHALFITAHAGYCISIIRVRGGQTKY